MNSQERKESRLKEFLNNPKRGLWSLATPIMIGMMVQTIYMMVDMFFVGQVSADAITALAFNLPLLFFGIGLVFGIGSGVTAVIAQYIGAKDKKNADNSAEHAIILGLVLGLLLTFLGISQGKEILTFLGIPRSILPLAWDYFSVIAMAYTFLVLSVFFRSILSGEGDMKTPMIIQGGGTILNIILDPIFIFTFGLGVKGAAIATAVSQISVATIFAYILLVKQHSYIRFSLKEFSFSSAILVKIFKIGIPASFSMIIMALGSGVFNRILVIFSSEAVAGYQIGIRIDHIFLVPAISISTSLVTLVGMFYGAKRYDLVRSTTIYAIKSCVIIAIGIGAFFFFSAPTFVGFFSDDQFIKDIGVQYLRYFIFGYPFIAISMISGRAIQGLGNGIPMLVLTFMRVLLVSVALSLYFIFILQKSIEWVWIAQLISVVVASLVSTFWLIVVFRNLEEKTLR